MISVILSHKRWMKGKELKRERHKLNLERKICLGKTQCLTLEVKVSLILVELTRTSMMKHFCENS